jgi:integrase/recombinase XerD
MAYFKLEFGFGKSKSEGKISDSANHADEQAVLEIPGWDFVKGEVERAKPGC